MLRFYVIGEHCGLPLLSPGLIISLVSINSLYSLPNALPRVNVTLWYVC